MRKIKGFEEVETPPWAERFVKTAAWADTVTCVVCGKRGFPCSSEQSEIDFPRWWTVAHQQHVRCTCGEVTTVKGIAQHRTGRARFGRLCPPVGKKK